jgi:uncharacterized membrane protein
VPPTSNPGQGLVAAATSLAVGALAHSIRVRGLRRGLVFAALGLGTGAAGEWMGVNLAHAVRHHSRPQVVGVPVAAVLSWYSITYAAFTMVERLAGRRRASQRGRFWALPVGTAALATSLDLVLDCYGLDQGLWEWPSGGAYARELAGPNGRHGIPVSNFLAWVTMTGTTSLAYLFVTRGWGGPPALPRAGGTRALDAGSLLLAPYYVLAAGWAIRNGHGRYLVYSGLVPIVLGALRVRGTTPRR